MCGIYTNTDPILYESRTRALRIHGVITTVRLENLFWSVLQEIAEREAMTTNQFIVKLHDELTGRRGETGNFASFLRVCCLRCVTMQEANATPPRAIAPRQVSAARHEAPLLKALP